MSYFIYARKSRKDADLEALGIDVLERHITTLLELAKTLSLPIGAIYREVVSGDSIDSRPVMSQVMAEVESCMWDGCLVMDVDRLARGDTIDQGRVQRAFFYSNTKIVTPNKTYDPANEYDNEYFEFSLFMSRREYATIKRRMQRGRERSSSDGYYVGNIPPYGWRRVIAPDGKHFSLAPDPTESPVLDLMYDLCGNKQYGYQKACTHMAEMGILSRSGRPFTPSTLKGIISNPANIGKVRSKMGKFLVLARTRQIIFLPMQFGRPGSARTFSSVPTSQKGAAPLRCVMTDRFRIFLPVLSGVPSVAG